MKKYIREIAPKLVIRLLFHIIYIAAIASLPYIIKSMIDEDYSSGMQKVFFYIGIFTLMILAGMAAQYITQRTAWHMDYDLYKMVRGDLFSSIIKRDATVFSQKDIGEYTSMLENDVNALGEYVEYCLDTVESVISLITYAVFIFMLDFRIAGVIYTVTFITLFLPKVTAKRLADKKNHLLNETGKYISKVNDLLSGFQIINNETERGFLKRYHRSLDEMEESRLEYGTYKTFVNVFNGTMMYMIDISAFAVIGVLLATGNTTVGVATATITYIREFSAPLRGMIDSISSVKSVSGVKEKLLAEIDINDAHGKTIEFGTEIVFDNVCVRYKEFEMKDFSYRFVKGKKYAIIGESGSGKSTLLRILMKCVQPDSGSITVDGYDIQQLDIPSMTGYMNQNTHIFAENFEDNVRVFGSYSKEQFQNVKRKFGNNMVDSVSGKAECNKCSGGEKQLIALMRTLMAEKSLLLLDEPFAALDKEKEKRLTEILLKEEGTVLLVTHNISPEYLGQFDSVLRMEKTNDV